jgi:hypothetical protein
MIGGATLDLPSLPSYLTVKIIMGDMPVRTTLNGTKYTESAEGRMVTCEVHSTIHVNRVVTLPHSWTEGYISTYPNRWQGELLATIVQRYGLTLDPPSYS